MSNEDVHDRDLVLSHIERLLLAPRPQRRDGWHPAGIRACPTGPNSQTIKTVWKWVRL